MTAQRPTDNLRGIALMTGSMALFAVEDMFLKLSTAGLPTGEVLLATCAFGTVVFGLMARAEGKSLFDRAILHPLVLLRLLAEVISAFSYIFAIAAVPLPIVAAVLQATPLAVTLGAVLFMGEAVGWRRWAAIAVGFAGVLVVVRPGAAGFTPAMLWMIICVATLALRDLASRRIPRSISTAQVSGWGVGAVAAMGLGMGAVQGWTVPDGTQSLWLFGAMIFGNAGYWAITQATRVAEASAITPYRYSRLIFVLALALPIFGERPDAGTLLGAGLIIGSGLYSFMRERQRARSALSTGPIQG